MKKWFFLKHYNFVLVLTTIYWLLAMYGRYKHDEIFPFFHWGLYANIPEINTSYYLKIFEINGKEQDISFYDYNKGRLDFRVLEKNLREYIDSPTQQNIPRLKAFLPNCSVSEVYTIKNKNSKSVIGYIINE